MDNPDDSTLPPDARSYLRRLHSCLPIIDEAVSRKMNVDGVKVSEAIEICLPVYNGMQQYAASVLFGGDGGGTALKDVTSVRKMIVDLAR
jgi:hypothetical protein